MQPQDFVDNLQAVQKAANKIVIASSAISMRTGEFLEFLGSGEDLRAASSYGARLAQGCQVLNEALEEYARAATRLGRGGRHE